MLTKTMALERARGGTRVNAVAPGAITTDMNRDLLENHEEMRETPEQIPMGRIGEAEKVAAMAVFLSSDKARYVTGSTFFVDGGLTLYPSFCIDCARGSVHS